MTSSKHLPVAAPNWTDLRHLTDARIALGRAGGSLRTPTLLDFRLAHARARDAVHAEFDAANLAAVLREANLETLALASRARSRAQFLLRPDLGRRLEAGAVERLNSRTDRPADIVILLSDGLSATAAHAHGPDTAICLHRHLTRLGRTVFPVVLVPFGRVKLQDEVGEILQAKQTVMLLGERPGLGAPDSLGAYLTYGPEQRRNDADRNCVSNIRASGLPPEAAAEKLAQLLTESLRLKTSGVQLKDTQLPPLPPVPRD